MGRYANLPDYIQGITYEIWEGRQISLLETAYGKDMIMRSTLGLIEGNKEVIKDTLASLAAFPDRLIFGTDVIWSGNEEEGYLSSHRSVITGTHTGHGVFGAPTGKFIVTRAVADCYVKDEVILDEWLCYDFSSMVRQLGYSSREWAQLQIEREGGPKSARRPFTDEIDKAGPYKGRGNDHPLGARLAEILSGIMNFDISIIGKTYDRACEISHPGDVAGWGVPFAEAQWMQLRTAFPDAKFEIHHQIGRNDAGQPDRAAIRWSLKGKHTGYGVFGEPTHAPVYIMGFTHAEFGPWGLKREWSFWDDVAIWKQILLHIEGQKK